MVQGKERRNEVTTRNEKAGLTSTRKEEKCAGASAEEATRKRSEATFILSADRKT
jgi:hypothetical protein